MRYLSIQNLGLLAGAVWLTAMPSTGPVRADELQGASLVQHLRAGGYVLLMRHAHSPTALPTREIAETDNLALERQLDKQGRDTAQAMGKAIKQLHIPIGQVLSSPTYRALETVRLEKLDAAQPTPQLGDGGQSMMREAVIGQSNWLRAAVEKRPMSRTNILLVTHMPNIQAAFPQEAADLTDGEMLVFDPDRKGNAKLVAKIKIEEWPKLAGH